MQRKKQGDERGERRGKIKIGDMHREKKVRREKERRMENRRNKKRGEERSGDNRQEKT